MLAYSAVVNITNDLISYVHKLTFMTKTKSIINYDLFKLPKETNYYLTLCFKMCVISNS